MMAFALYLYLNGNQSLQQLLGAKGAWLAVAALIGIAAIRYRLAILDYIDRRFFREQYDARMILTLLVERIRSVDGLATLTREIDRALHVGRFTGPGTAAGYEFGFGSVDLEYGRSFIRRSRGPTVALCHAPGERSALARGYWFSAARTHPGTRWEPSGNHRLGGEDEWEAFPPGGSATPAGCR
jgi:hypothetical protein